MGMIMNACQRIPTPKNSTITALRRLIQTTGDLDLAVRYGVPRSTAQGWLKQSRTDVVSMDVLDMDAEALQREVLSLRRRVTRLLALLQLVVVAIKVVEFSFDRVRIPDGTRKQRLLWAIERARAHMPIRGALKLIGLRTRCTSQRETVFRSNRKQRSCKLGS